MSKASDLIEQAERDAGCQWDDPDNPNALTTLFGAVAREIGMSKFAPKDDFVVGVVLRDDLRHGEARRQAQELMVSLLKAGLSPDDVRELTNKGGG